ncbi:MAG: hypothetical protein R3A48_03435 [Polyangiales bacterium]
MRIGTVATALALSVFAGAPRGGAQSGSRVEASIRMRQGAAAARRGEWEEAQRLLQNAADLGAPPQVYRALAEASEALGQLRAASEALSRYVALATGAADREEAAARQEQLRRTLGELLVEVRPGLAGRAARVWVDRDGPRPYPAGGLRAMVEGGTHRVRVESQGWQTFEQRVTTGYGEPLAVRVQLTAVAPR